MKLEYLCSLLFVCIQVIPSIHLDIIPDALMQHTTVLSDVSFKCARAFIELDRICTVMRILLL